MSNQELHPGVEEMDAGGLHICPKCDSSLVQPVSWLENVGERSWNITLQCPSCYWEYTGDFPQDLVLDHEKRLDDGLAAVKDELGRLSRKNMTDDIDRFVRALNEDQILPEDFYF